jgi:hypothetical protein
MRNVTVHDAYRAKYYDEGTVLSNSQVEAEYNLGGRPSRTQITVDLATSFTFIIGIFFPSVTGKVRSLIKKKI